MKKALITLFLFLLSFAAPVVQDSALKAMSMSLRLKAASSLVHMVKR
jgi:hypothetical protein